MLDLSGFIWQTGAIRAESNPSKRLNRFLTAVAVLAAVANATSAQPALQVTYRNTVVLPTSAADQFGQPFTLAGLSGVTFVGIPGVAGAGGDFLAVLDNSNRLARLAVDFLPNAAIVGVTVLDGFSLSESRDFEGIATLDASASTVLLAEEGTPAIREFGLVDGPAHRVIGTPPIYAEGRPNFGFESLTHHAISGSLWTANEEALTPDGSLSSQAAGTIVRLQRLVRNPDGEYAAAEQFAYRVEPLHGSPISGSRSGLCELVALPSGRLLALERSLAFSFSGLFQTRIYEVETSAASDVGGLPSLTGAPFTPVGKRLLWSGSLNNLEGLCLGPQVSPGQYALLGIVDDGDPLSTGAVVAFDLTGPVACPADSNSDGSISVQDLFDFLAAYFSGFPAADVNGSQTLTVQDIFDFLTAYFTGC